MKILFAIKTVKKSKGGSERVISMIASGLAQRGYEIELLTFDTTSGDCLYPLHPAVNTRWLGIGDAGAKAGLLESYRRMLALRRYISQTGPDVVIAFQHSMFVLMAFALLGKPVPHIASEHIVPAHYQHKPLEYLLMCVSAYLSDRVTVLSDAIKNLYPVFLHSRMRAMPNPVMYSQETGNCRGNSSSTGLILNVGRLDKQKDHTTLIQAFASLKDKYPDWRLCIIGSGQLKQQLQDLIASLDCLDRIELQDCVDEISKVYREADIFAMSSRYESFGLVTAEAMAFALPVVGFADCPGTNELIIDGVNGLLVASNDRAAAFATGLEKLMRDPGLRARLGQHGRQHVKRFDIEQVLDQWESLIGEVCQ